jgi:isoquinoline 1-oxidoreductase beta subunit
MGTGGSRGIRTSEDYVRRGAAAARIMLLQAAADQWKVPVGELTVSDGIITHAATKRRTSYGKVAAAAAKLTPPDPKSITLKDPKQWKVAGKPLKRLDTAPKLDGSLVYAIDVKLPGMLCASIKACPVFGGKLVSYDEAKVLSRPGVRGVVKVNDYTVAVVADTWWRANTALQALPIVWDEGAGATRSSATDCRAPGRGSRGDQCVRLPGTKATRRKRLAARSPRSRRRTARRSSRTRRWSR